MATSLEYQKHQTQGGSHLMLNTFGPSILYYNDKEIARSGEATKQPLGTPDFKFLVRVNQNGSFDVQKKDGIDFNVTLETNVKICQIQARDAHLLIPPWYRLEKDILSQKYAFKKAEFQESHFRVRLVNRKEVFGRVDIRYLQSSWATITFHGDQILNVCLNGVRQLVVLQTACESIKEKSRASAEYQYGLGLKPNACQQEDDNQSVRSTSSRQSNTSKFEEAMPQSMPLDPNELERTRQRYIQQLEMSLAALKLPTFGASHHAFDK